MPLSQPTRLLADLTAPTRDAPGSPGKPREAREANAGTYELSNPYEVNALAGMLSRADFARQVRDVPEGEKIRIVPY